MLALVGTCCIKFETGQTFRPMQTDATLLANNTQKYWELLALVASVCMGLRCSLDKVPQRSLYCHHSINTVSPNSFLCKRQLKFVIQTVFKVTSYQQLVVTV